MTIIFLVYLDNFVQTRMKRSSLCRRMQNYYEITHPFVVIEDDHVVVLVIIPMLLYKMRGHES